MGENEMNCRFCGGMASVCYEDLSLLGGKVVLKGEPYFKCIKCGKEFVTSEQMRETESKVSGFSFGKQVISTGRSLAITIPSEIVEFYSMKKGTKVRMIPENRNTMKIVFS
jgi:hypothetical protein